MSKSIDFIMKVANVAKRLSIKQRLYAIYVDNPECGNVVAIEVKPIVGDNPEKVGTHKITIIPSNFDYLKKHFKPTEVYQPLTDVEISELENDGIIILTDK